MTRSGIRSDTFHPGAVALITLFVAGALQLASPVMAAPQQATNGVVIVYFLDHQFLPDEEAEILQEEISAIFADAGLDLRWVPQDSPRRRLNPNELRLLVLPSDGTRWFHGPSNVIGIAPHDDDGTGRNCFVFYRQAIWFRQQAVFRCREAIQARTEAEIRGVAVDPFIEALAPADCGDRLPSLTAMIVARAAAHEMVHILLNKLDHGSAGLMRSSFDIGDWFEEDNSRFRLTDDDIRQLRDLLSNGAPAGH